MHLKQSGLHSVAIVCRANLVRSRLVEAILKDSFPHIEFRSFGTKVRKESNPSPKLISIAEDWGLSLTTHAPQEFSSDIEFVKNSNLVLALDDQVLEALRLRGINSINLTDFAIDSKHIPVDPYGMSAENYLQNISKAAHCAIRFRNHLLDSSIREYNIRALIPQDSSSNTDVRRGMNFVDSRLQKYSSKSGLTHDVIFFDENVEKLCNPEARLSSKYAIYAAKFEFPKPEKFLLSLDWYYFVKEISSLGTTGVLTAPLTSGSRKIHLAYFASAVANEVEYL